MQLIGNVVNGASPGKVQNAGDGMSPIAQVFNTFFAVQLQVLAPSWQRANGNPTLEQQVFQDCPHP